MMILALTCPWLSDKAGWCVGCLLLFQDLGNICDHCHVTKDLTRCIVKPGLELSLVLLPQPPSTVLGLEACTIVPGTAIWKLQIG